MAGAKLRHKKSRESVSFFFPVERLFVATFLSFVELNGYGDIYYEFVDERGQFQVSVWKDILLSPRHKAFVDDLKSKNRFSYLLHDQCMRGSKPVEALDEVFGEGNWGTAPPPPCKKITGSRITQVRASPKRRGHTRKIKTTTPFKRCHCSLPHGAQAAKIPEANRAEHFFNRIENELKTLGRTKGWPKNRQELKDRISHIIDTTPSSWFSECFKTLPETWEKMVARRGALTEDYVPKYS